jgi:hypothetical protein
MSTARNHEVHDMMDGNPDHDNAVDGSVYFGEYEGPVWDDGYDEGYYGDEDEDYDDDSDYDEDEDPDDDSRWPRVADDEEEAEGDEE